MFLFDDFMDATVYYPNLNKLNLKMNYNSIQDAVFVLNQQGSISVLSTSVDFGSIVVPERNVTLIWIKDKGFYEKIPGGESLLISHRTQYEINEVKKGPYTMMPTTVNAERAQSRILHDRDFIIGNHYISLPNPSNGIVEVELIYTPILMMVLRNELQPVPNKRELRKLFPDDRSSINEFLKENNVDFNDKSELVKLALFLQSFQ